MLWSPREYQKTSIRFLLQHSAAGLFLDPGLGKSSIVLAALKIRKTPALIVAPLQVCFSVWPEEVKKWADFSHLRVSILHGPEKYSRLQEMADIYLINPEGLSWLVDNRTLLHKSVTTLVVDESTQFKNTTTVRFKALKSILKKFDTRWILTGTPVAETLLDIYGQIYLLDYGEALGKNITTFRRTYFYQTGYGGYQYTLQPDAAEKIYEKIGPLTLRLGIDELSDLPELVENVVSVVLPAEARRVYDELETSLTTLLDNGETLSAVSIATALGKCRQLAGGSVYYAPAQLGAPVRLYYTLHTEKIAAVRRIVEECSGKPVLISYVYRHELQRLLEEFGETTPYIGGGTTPESRASIANRWNSGEIPILLGHPQAMGLGLNLQHRCGHVIFFTLPQSYQQFVQTIFRLYRSGNTSEKVIVHKIIAKDTVDVVVGRSLSKKGVAQEDFFEAIRKYRTIGEFYGS